MARMRQLFELPKPKKKGNKKSKGISKTKKSKKKKNQHTIKQEKMTKQEIEQERLEHEHFMKMRDIDDILDGDDLIPANLLDRRLTETNGKEYGYKPEKEVKERDQRV